MEQIAFIGTGVMGSSMAGHLLAAGYPVSLYTRTKSKAQGLLDQGARWAESVTEAVKQADVVITMVGYPQDVEALYLGPQGIIDTARNGTILIDMTTSSPNLARRIAEAAAARGLEALDAPVSGGDIGARNGTLSIMVGGSEKAFRRAQPIFQKMGKTIFLQGGPGSGQHCKMCNQIVIASTMMGVAEALAYGLSAGLEPRTMLASIESGAAGSWSLSNLLPRMLDGNVKPGFYVKHFIKDMGIALESARELGLNLPGLAQAETLYRKLAALDSQTLAKIAADIEKARFSGLSTPLFPEEAQSGADLGTQALYLLYLARQL
ncbi:MAG: NAD(P)-dependent oxidoreductase [Treponema sp.]|nr:NAD(P)-dependent oxidoreductase [Treponema sp.]